MHMLSLIKMKLVCFYPEDCKNKREINVLLLLVQYLSLNSEPYFFFKHQREKITKHNKGRSVHVVT